MGKTIIDFNEEGEMETLFDDEKDITNKVITTTPDESTISNVPVIEEQDDIDLKPDDTLEDLEDEEE